MTDLRQAAQQALDALKSGMAFDKNAAVLQNLRTALAQPEQEPSAWRDMVVVNLVREGINKHKARDLADHFATAAQPEQVDCPRCGHVCSQRPWQGLTHQQTKDRMQAWDGNDAYVLCRAIEQALKERNT